MSEQHREPALRFKLEQTWWVASELARRSGGYLTEFSVQDGFYFGLEMRRGGAENDGRVSFNYGGSLHFWPGKSSSDQHSHESIPSANLLASDDPHHMVKQIESIMGWRVTNTAATNPRTLVYRVISGLLSASLNHQDGLMAIRDQSFIEWGGQREYASEQIVPFTQHLPELLRNSAEKHPNLWLLFAGNLNSPQGRRVQVALSETGFLLMPKRKPVDLMAIYRKRNRLNDVIARVL